MERDGSATGADKALFFVPLALLDKAPLANFSLRDEDDAAVPILTRSRNAALAVSILVALLQGAAAQDPEFAGHGKTVPAELEAQFWKIAAGAPPQSSDALRRLSAVEQQDAAAEAWRRRAVGDARLCSLARALAGSFLLCAPLSDAGGRRGILKYTYEHHGDSPSCGCLSRLLLPSDGGPESYLDPLRL